jgi:acetyl esterase
MNWRTKIVLLFGKLAKPIDYDAVSNIIELRAKADRAVKLGVKIFDRKVAVQSVQDTSANGVPVRIYKNSDKKSQRVIIYFHGGGFVLYGLDSHDRVCRRLCKMNDCIVVAVDYRLAPEFTFPVAHDDAFNAIQWVKENIAKYGGNPDDLVVAGDSAGGNLSACMAHRCKRDGIALKAQVLVYPWIDGKLSNPSITTNGSGYMLEKKTVFWFRKQYTPREEDRCHPHVSPCYETDFTGLAPAFILTAQFDPLLDDGFNYYKQLEQAGNKVLYKEYPGLIHSFFNIPRIDPLAMKAYIDIQEFLKAV